MADSEEEVSADTGAEMGGDMDDSGDAGTDFPKVEAAPEPDNPRYSTEHEEPSGEPQPIPGAES